jgi:hypothetical protein
MSRGENVLEELDAVETSEVSQERPERITSHAATGATTAVRNASTGSVTSPPTQHLHAHPQTSSSAMRNERPPTESLSRASWATTETAFVALMLCELKTATTTTALADSSAFVTPSIP